MRAENERDTFAAALDEATASDTPTPPARPGKTTETRANDTAIEKADDADTEAKADADVPVPTAPDTLPPPARPGKTTETRSKDIAIEKADDADTEVKAHVDVPVPTATATQPPLPATDAELAASLPSEEATTAPAPNVPAVPVEAAAPAAALPAPSAAPVAAPLPTAGSEPSEASSEDKATSTEAGTSDTALLPVLDDAPAPPRLRDAIEQAKSGNAAAAHAPTGASQASTAEGGTEPTATSPSSPQTSPAEGTPATSKAAAEPALAATASADPVEPTQTAQSASAPETRAAEATAAATPVLSTLSQGAIHAMAQIAAQIVKKLEGRSTRFEMALTPDDLGRVDVSLDIDADGQLSARLAFDNPLAAADLRGRVDELRRQLTDAGFTVADDALSFDQREPSAGAGGFDRGHDRNPARAFGAASRLSLDAEASLVPPRWMSLTLTPERVDMKV